MQPFDIYDMAAQAECVNSQTSTLGVRLNDVVMQEMLLRKRNHMDCNAWRMQHIAKTCQILIVCHFALHWHYLKVACAQVLCVAWGNGLRSTIYTGTTNPFFVNLQTSETEKSNYDEVYDGDMVSYIVQPPLPLPGGPSLGPSASN